MNPFQTLGLDPRYDLDPDELEQRYRALQRALHPDKFSLASAAERRMSLGKAVEVNEAYRTLRDDVRRGEALLTLRGAPVNEKAQAADPEFLMEIMELREELSGAKAARDFAKVRALKERVSSEQRTQQSALVHAFAQNDVSRAAASVSKLRYFKRFLEEVAVVEDEAQSG